MTIRIVVVDDEPDIRSLITAIVEHADEDWSVVGVGANGFDAVTLCADLRPDVLVLDEMMPQMSGLTAARLILDRSSQRIAVVLFTARPPEDLIDDATGAGVDAVLSKLAFPDLVPTLRGLVGPAMPE